MSHHVPDAEETAILLEKKRDCPCQTLSSTRSQPRSTRPPEHPYQPWEPPFDVLYRHELEAMFDLSLNPTFVSAIVHGGNHDPSGTMDVQARTPRLKEEDAVDSIHLSLDLSRPLPSAVEDLVGDVADQVIRGTLRYLISRCHS